mmetsp:Transcript_9402/g.20616  ORF Transcript_9402/g.20616 Transcript_9402/m.20616 type:complete len:270 (-) Transcript_9402:202-1011(-)
MARVHSPIDVHGGAPGVGTLVKAVVIHPEASGALPCPRAVLGARRVHLAERAVGAPHVAVGHFFHPQLPLGQALAPTVCEERGSDGTPAEGVPATRSAAVVPGRGGLGPSFTLQQTGGLLASLLNGTPGPGRARCTPGVGLALVGPPIPALAATNCQVSVGRGRHSPRRRWQSPGVVPTRGRGPVVARPSVATVGAVVSPVTRAVARAVARAVGCAVGRAVGRALPVGRGRVAGVHFSPGVLSNHITQLSQHTATAGATALALVLLRRG